MIGNAVRVMRIATGEETETLPADDGKDPAAKALGKKGGAARAKEHVAGKTCGDRKRGRGKTLGEKGVTHFTRHHIFCNLLSLTADGRLGMSEEFEALLRGAFPSRLIVRLSASFQKAWVWPMMCGGIPLGL